MSDKALDRPDETDPGASAHWWREPIAGAIALGIGCWDTWHFGRDGGLTTSLDELLVIGGIVLLAGSRRWMPNGKQLPQPKEPKP